MSERGCRNWNGGRKDERVRGLTFTHSLGYTPTVNLYQGVQAGGGYVYTSTSRPMAVTMQPVSSSWIAALGWEGVRGKPGTAYMQTRDGNVYPYFGMPWTFFRLWLESSSKGVFYSRSIRGRYPEGKPRRIVNQNL